MRAVAVHRTGDAPELIDLPKPVPGAGEVLVKLAAASINPMDWKIAEGQLIEQLPHAFPLILGADGAGRVEAVGEGTRRFTGGESVFGQFFLVPVGSGGSLAEYVAVPEEAATSLLEPLPAGITVEDAAAIPTAGMTALGALDATGLDAGQTILIIGATGGIGSFATQLAVARGARVIATAKPDARDWITGLGAAETTGYTAEEIAADIRAAHPDGIDVILDLVGNRALFDAATGLVRDGGAALSTAFGAPPEQDPDSKVTTTNYILMDHKASLLARVVELIEAGRVTVPVQSRITLAEAADALARNKAGGARGKTIVRI